MDLNKTAFRIVEALSKQESESKRSVANRIGGKVGGAARAKALSPSRRKEIAVIANKARWEGQRRAGSDSK